MGAFGRWLSQEGRGISTLEIGPGCSLEGVMSILWPPDAKSWLIWKDPDAGKDSRQEEKGTTEDEMVGWHHRLNGHGFGWTPGAGDGQGGLVCCSLWGRKESDTTELNWRDTIEFSSFHYAKLQWEACNCKGALTWLFRQSDLRLPDSRTFRKNLLFISYLGCSMLL